MGGLFLHGVFYTVARQTRPVVQGRHRQSNDSGWYTSCTESDVPGPIMTPHDSPSVSVEHQPVALASLISTAVALSVGIALAAAAMLIAAGMWLERF